MDNVRFGIVGLGSIAGTHALAINAIDKASLVSCYHKNMSKAEAFGARYGAKAFDDFDAFLSSGIDALVITTPSAIRAEYAIPAMRKGINVIVEKPMDIKLESAMSMMEESKKCGVKFAVIFQNRFSPLNVEIRKAVSSGRLGKRILSSCYVKWFRSQEYYDSGAWRGDKEIDGGGALMNQAIHGLDLLLSLSSPLDSVFSFSALLNHERINVEDTIVASLKFKDGSLGGFEASTASYPGCNRRIELTGSDGTIVAEDDHLITWKFKSAEDGDDEIIRRFSSSSSSPADSPRVGFENHKAEYEDFVSSILSDRAPIVDGNEGLKSLKAVLAIYESARTAHPVSLSS